jgi:hypothetical protein
MVLESIDQSTPTLRPPHLLSNRSLVVFPHRTSIRPAKPPWTGIQLVVYPRSKTRSSWKAITEWTLDRKPFRRERSLKTTRSTMPGRDVMPGT